MSDAPRWLEQLADGSLDDVTEVEIDTRLRLSSGRLVACDPLVFLRGSDPFARAVEPGDYAVVLGKTGEEIAYALVRLTERRRKVARWEVARCPGEEDVEGWPGFGVDSGVGCFVDAAAIEAFLQQEEALDEQVEEKLAAEGVSPSDAVAFAQAFEEHRAGAGPAPLAEIEPQIAERGWASLGLAPAATEGGTKEGAGEKAADDLVAFPAGTGDGVYASFWGLDRKGEPVCLVTDFGLFPEEEEADEDALDFEEDFDGDFDLGEDEAGQVTATDLAGLEALAAALGAKPEEPEERQGPSPLFLQTRDLVKKWIATEKIELEPDANLDAFAEALLEKIVSLQGQRHPGAHVAEWLLERSEVADVFASDDELERDLTG